MLNETEKRAELARLFAAWTHLTTVQQDTLVRIATQSSYKKGAAIHNGSLDCVGLILIRTGKVRVFILSDEGKEITLYRLSAGEMCILSASCVVPNITFDVHIEAETDVEALIIDSGHYAELRDENIFVRCVCYELLTDRFSDVMWAMQQILFMSFDRRLAIFLWDEYATSGDEVIHLTHEQVAKYTGSAREVVTRMLKYFAEEGIVELMRGGIRILDKQKLKALL